MILFSDIEFKLTEYSKVILVIAYKTTKICSCIFLYNRIIELIISKVETK
jgi:hypothetical protein